MKPIPRVFPFIPTRIPRAHFREGLRYSPGTTSWGLALLWLSWSAVNSPGEKSWVTSSWVQQEGLHPGSGLSQGLQSRPRALAWPALTVCSCRFGKEPPLIPSAGQSGRGQLCRKGSCWVCFQHCGFTFWPRATPSSAISDFLRSLKRLPSALAQQ